MIVAGVDGCKGGWIAVSAPVDGFADAHAAVHASFEKLLASAPDTETVAVDMPIGFPERIVGGGRGPEQALRAALGARRNSVFSMPSRATIAELKYVDACRVARDTSDPPRAIAQQAFHLFPKIREIDALLRANAAGAERVFETHPEGGFAALNRGPLRHAKKTAAGSAERIALLGSVGFPVSLLTGAPPRGAARDDLLDACVACWSATRIARGEARAFPPDYERDSYGLPIVIWT